MKVRTKIVFAVFTIAAVSLDVAFFSFSALSKRATGEDVFSIVDLDKQFLLVVLGVLVVSLALAYAGAYFSLASIRRLRKDAEQMLGNPGYRAQEKCRDEAGEVARVLNRMADTLSACAVSTQFEKEEELVERDRISVILSNIRDGVFVLDREMRIILFNLTAQDVSGFSEQDVLGKRYDEVIQLVDEGNVFVGSDFIKKVYATGRMQTAKGDMLLITKRGLRVPIVNNASPLKDWQGNVSGCVVVFRDLTEEYTLEESERMFLSVLSHQLRTPLGSVRWNLELLMNGELGKVSQEAADVIKKVNDTNMRLLRLVDDLLGVSYVKRGNVMEDSSDLSLNDLIEDIMEDMQPMARKFGVSFVYDLGKNIPNISVSRKQVTNILQNLLSNAIKYNKKNGKVTVTTKVTGKSIRIIVADTGIGIPEEDAPKIFSRFYRASNVNVQNSQGSGIGLFIAKMYIEECGGKMWFESEEDVGTTFFVELPIQDQNAGRAIVRKGDSLYIKQGFHIGEGERYILLAEDDASYASVFVRKLEHEGFRVKVAKNGRGALDMIREKKPDLLILDLVMPDMDGETLLIHLKEEGLMKGLKSIVCSNLSQQSDIERAMQLGVDEYIIKSDVSIHEVIARVKKRLAQ